MKVDVNNSFLDAIYSENIEECKIYLNKGVDVNFINSEQDSPLLVAIRTHNIELIELLLQNGANPNLQGTYTTPLNAAIDGAVGATNNDAEIISDSTEIIELLLKYHAQIHLRDMDGQTAYEFAKNYHLPAQKLFDRLIAEEKEKPNNNSWSVFDGMDD